MSLFLKNPRGTFYFRIVYRAHPPILSISTHENVCIHILKFNSGLSPDFPEALSLTPLGHFTNSVFDRD